VVKAATPAMSPERLSRESWEFFREEGIEEKNVEVLVTSACFII
jgi:hypothetical protein